MFWSYSFVFSIELSTIADAYLSAKKFDCISIFADCPDYWFSVRVKKAASSQKVCADVFNMRSTGL